MIAIPLALASSTFPGHGFVHSTGFVVATNAAVCLAVAFWLGLAFWVYRDARRRTREPFLRVLATLLGLVPPYIGPVVYLLFRPAETLDDVRSRRRAGGARAAARPSATHMSDVQHVCGAGVPRLPRLHHDAARTVREVQRAARPLWQMRPYCATPVELSLADLDAALTGGAQTIALVNDTIPLVSQPEQRAAGA